MKNYHLFFLFVFFIPCRGEGQNLSTGPAAVDTFTLEKTISMQADFFSVDNLGNLYSVKGGQVEKYSSQWKQVNTYSSNILGKITAIDVNNPMKIVMFYKDLSQVVFLDNTLSRQGDPVALEKAGLEQAILICSSLNNGIWAYDQRSFQLVRLDQNLKTIAETGNIIQQAGGDLAPDFLLEKNNRVYLNDSSRGILVFDIYGTYSKTFPLKIQENFQIIEDVVFFVKDKFFFSFSMKTLELKEISLPETEFKQVMTDGKKLYILTENELKVIRLGD